MSTQHSAENVISRKIAKALLQDNDKIMAPLSLGKPEENIFLLKEDGVYTYAFRKIKSGYKRVWYPELMMSRWIKISNGNSFSFNGTTIKLNEEYYLENSEYKVQ